MEKGKDKGRDETGGVLLDVRKRDASEEGTERC